MIQQVTASCGCTTPGWTKAPIAAGANGKITVTYNTTDRPGHFTKTITVISNSDNSPVQLTIHGTVTPKPLSQDQAFPVDFGAIRLLSSTIPLGNIAKGEIKRVSIPVLNSSDNPVALALDGLPRYITATVQPSVVAPGKTASLQITYNSGSINDLAFRHDRILLVVNNNREASKHNVLTVAGYISEDFASLTPGKRNTAPIAVMAEKEIKLGKIKADSKVSGSIAITNKGKSPLLILKAFSGCNCVSFDLPKHGITAGQTATLRFVVKTGSQSPAQMIENVNLMTNSPATPDLQFQIRWENTPSSKQGC